jgi:hypothetical protein
MRSLHTIEVQLVFNNTRRVGSLISQRDDAYALADKVSAVGDWLERATRTCRRYRRGSLLRCPT